MALPIEKGHYEALASSDISLKALVGSKFSESTLNSFVSSYNGPRIDVRALFPILNLLKVEFHSLDKKYDLGGINCDAFLASEEDASKLICFIDFLTFVSQNLRDKSQKTLLDWFIGFNPCKYFFAANLDVAIASMIFYARNGDSHEHRSIEEKQHQAYIFAQRLDMAGFIPMYESFANSKSNYSQYLDCSQTPPPQTPICLGQFSVSAEEVNKHTTMELIKMGMSVLPRVEWPRLIYVCRKAVVGREFDLQERQKLVGLHVLQSILDENMRIICGKKRSIYSQIPYVDIFDASLLHQFPDLTRYAISILTRYNGSKSPRQNIHERIQSDELFLCAIKANNAALIEAIVGFYDRPYTTWKTLTPIVSVVIMRKLEELSRKNQHLPVQIGMIKALKNSINEKDMGFAPADEYTTIIQSLISMVQQNLGSASRENLEILKGLLMIVQMLLDYDSSQALTLANDSVTLSVLAAALKHECLQVSAIRCLCVLLNADILCYAAVDQSGLWGDYLSTTDPFSHVLLFSTLIHSDKGREFIFRHNMVPKLLETVFGYSFTPNRYSNEYYYAVADAIVTDSNILAFFGEQVPAFLLKVLGSLDQGPDESAFNIKQHLWKQYSHLANIAEHTLLLLSSVINRDQVRSQLTKPENFNVLMNIISHAHLPYQFISSLNMKPHFSHVINELFIIDNADNIVNELFGRLAHTMELDLIDTAVLRKLQLYLGSLAVLNLRKGQEFLKHIMETILRNPDFQHLATRLPRTIESLVGLQYDYMTGSEKDIISCFLFGGQARYKYVEYARLFQLQQLNGFERLKISQEEYNRAKATVLPVVLARCSCQEFTKFYEDLLSSAIKSRITFPQGFPPGQYSKGVVQVLASNRMETTRDRYILSECDFVGKITCEWHWSYLIYNDCMQVVTDHWVKLHTTPVSTETVNYENFVATNYFQCVKRILEQNFVAFGFDIFDWDTITAVDPGYSEAVHSDKYMEARRYVVSQIIKHRVPISHSMKSLWWQGDCNPIAHLPLRGYVLDNLEYFFKDQNTNGVRYGIYMVVQTLKTFEYQSPILDGLIPELFERRDLPSIALLAGLYSNPSLSFKISRPQIAQLKSVYDAIFVPHQAPSTIMCACQLLSTISPELIAELDDHISFVSKIGALIGSTKEPRAILGLLQLATLGCVTRSEMTYDLVNMATSVSNYCLSVFSSADYDINSVMAYSVLDEFNRAVLECDPAVLEMSMGFLIGEKCSKDGSDTKQVEIELSGYGNRSKTCFNSALSRYFMVDEHAELVFPRETISRAYNIPLVNNNELPRISPVSREFIDSTLLSFVAKSAKYIEASESLLQSHIHSDEFYYDICANLDLNHEAREVDRVVASTWANFRKAHFSLKLESNRLKYLTTAYGAPVEYISQHSMFEELILAGTRVATSIFMHSGGHKKLPSFRNKQFDDIMRFMTNLMSSTPWVVQRTVVSLKRLLEKPSLVAEWNMIALGVLYIEVPRGYNQAFLKALDETGLLSTCASILGLDKFPNESTVYDAAASYCGYYTLLSAGYQQYCDQCSKFEAERRYREQQTKSNPLRGMGSTFQATVVSEADSHDELGIMDMEESSSNENVNEAASEFEGEPLDPDNALYHGSDAMDVEESVSDENMDQTPSEVESEAAGLDGILGYDSDAMEEMEDEYYDYDEEEEEYEGAIDAITSGPFDVGTFRDLPSDELQFNRWVLQIPGSRLNAATTTLEDVSAPMDDEFQLFFSEIDLEYLTERNINIAPACVPEDQKYIPMARAYSCRPSIKKLCTFGYESQRQSDTSPGGAYLQLVIKHWYGMRSNANIDWSSVPRWTPSSSIVPATSHGLAGARPSIEESFGDATSQSGNNNNEHAYHIALSNATHLLENPSELNSWGLDAGYLESLPEDIRFDSLISYLLLNQGKDMGKEDIKATLDDFLYYETCLAAYREGLQAVPEYIKTSTISQLPKNEDITFLLRSVIYSDAPYNLVLPPEHIILLGSMVASARFDVYEIPRLADIKHYEGGALILYRDRLEACTPDLCMVSCLPFAQYFSKIAAQNFDLEPLIDIMENQQVLRNQRGLDTYLKCLGGVVREGQVCKISDKQVIRLLSLYLSSLVSSSSQALLNESIKGMVSRGFLSEDVLKRHLCVKILDQLEICIQAINEGDMFSASFSGLEAMLSALTRHSICDFSHGSEGIIEKAIELGQRVSEIIASVEDVSSSVRLLRCYLLLVVLTPNARPAFIAFVRENQKFVNRLISQDKSMLKSCMLNLDGHYDLLDFAVKAEVIRGNFPQKASSPPTSMVIRRENIFTDSFKHINSIPSSELVTQVFRIIFEAEMGFDGGGLTKEWLTLLARELPSKSIGLFNRVCGTGNNFIVHPNPQFVCNGARDLELYEFVGKLMAKAILLKQSFDGNFSRVIYSSIVSKGPGSLSLDELYLFDNDLAKSLEWILENDIGDVIMETFTAKSSAFGRVQLTELVPGGRDIAVTEANKGEYVDLVIKHTIFTSVKKQIEAICLGFWSLLPYPLVKILGAQELEKLLSGGELDIDEWKLNTLYQGLEPESLCVKCFWRAIKSMCDLERREVLMFATGTDKVSALGFGSGLMSARFTIAKLEKQYASGVVPLPVASTCVSTLYIPSYTSPEEALISLRKAQELGGLGFGLG